MDEENSQVVKENITAIAEQGRDHWTAKARARYPGQKYVAGLLKWQVVVEVVGQDDTVRSTLDGASIVKQRRGRPELLSNGRPQAGDHQPRNPEEQALWESTTMFGGRDRGKDRHHQHPAVHVPTTTPKMKDDTQDDGMDIFIEGADCLREPP